MPWFKVQSDNKQWHYYHYESEKELLLALIEKGTWQVKYKIWKPKKFNYRRLLTFYQELQSALESGFQINESLENLALTTSDSHLAKNCQALVNELNKGTHLNTALALLTVPHAQAYCELIHHEGSRENLDQSLHLSISQLDILLSWSSRLLKSIAYPFCIIQISLLMNVLHTLFLSNKDSDFMSQLSLHIGFYLLVSILQATIVFSFINGNASNAFERLNNSFRLTKLFTLLETTRKTGTPLQQALQNMPRYFQHTGIKAQTLGVYYSLKLGNNYEQSFPKQWFPNEAGIALQSTSQGGSIERCLQLATSQHKKRWIKTVTLYEKVIPAVCLVLAGSFVTSTLLSIYKPLLEIP